MDVTGSTNTRDLQKKIRTLAFHEASSVPVASGHWKTLGTVIVEVEWCFVAAIALTLSGASARGLLA